MSDRGAGPVAGRLELAGVESRNGEEGAHSLVDPTSQSRPHPSALSVVGAGLVVLAGVLVVSMFATRGLSSRIVRPDASGRATALPGFLGFDSWPYYFEAGGFIGFVLVGGWLALRSWREGHATPSLLFFLAASALAWLDPLGNWGPYATYDPRFLHWPDTWPWASLAPGIEPCFPFFGYFGFYMGVPVLVVFLLRRFILPRFSPTAFPRRHPLIALVCLTFVLGFVIDTLVEVSLLNLGVFVYQQVPSFGSINKGRTDQFPLLIQATATTIPFVVGALLWWRDESELTGAERLARRCRLRGGVGVFAVFFTLLSAGYLVYETPYIVIRATHSANVVARPWPWCQTKVYDPNGRYAASGVPGPYYVGVWPHGLFTTKNRPKPTPAGGSVLKHCQVP